MHPHEPTGKAADYAGACHRAAHCPGPLGKSTLRVSSGLPHSNDFGRAPFISQGEKYLNRAMDDIDSVLFSKLAHDKSLRHPTARNFDPEKWVAAAKTIIEPSTRDIRLLLAAIYYGNEISALRRTFEPELFADLDRRSATLLAIAMANYNFITLTDKALEARKKGGKDFIHLGLAGQTAFEIGYPGNHSSPDTAITAIVDTLPHCLERANRCPEHSTITKAKYWKLGAKLFRTMSIEHCLRDMWQAVLWENWELVRDENGNRHHQPVDRQLATLWHVWSWRHEMILSQGTNTDALVEKTQQLRGENADPFVSPTAIGIGAIRLRRGGSNSAMYLAAPLGNLGIEVSSRFWKIRIWRHS